MLVAEICVVVLDVDVDVEGEGESVFFPNPWLCSEVSSASSVQGRRFISLLLKGTLKVTAPMAHNRCHRPCALHQGKSRRVLSNTGSTIRVPEY